MTTRNIIVNGSFDQGNLGWDGTDLETNYDESAYHPSSTNPTNRVAEMDGNAGQTTVMSQAFEISDAGVYQLSFSTSLRSGVNKTVGEGFKVEVLDANGQPVLSKAITPGHTDWRTLQFDVDFPNPGQYTLRFTELGPDQSYGALIDDVKLLVCFGAGSLIETATGARPVEDLQKGELIRTVEGSFEALTWIGQREISHAEMSAQPNLRPVIFEAGSLGGGLPLRRLAVSPQHRMLITGWKAQLFFGEDEILVPAIGLVNQRDIRQDLPLGGFTYVHFLLDGHRIVLAEGSPSESFHPNDQSLLGLDGAARAEILALFPALAESPVPMARPSVRRRDAMLLSA